MYAHAHGGEEMIFENKKKATLILADGTEFEGRAFGADGSVVGEIVFTTAMVGYQETLTDPSYCGQIVTQTFPLIGNYGVNSVDPESNGSVVSGYIVREQCEDPANFRCEGELDSYLKKYNIIGIYDIDTRHLTKIIRESGVMNGAIVHGDFDKEALLAQIRAYNVGKVVPKVSVKAKEYYPAENAKFNVVLMDYGYKFNIRRELVRRGCNVTVMPWNSTADEIKALNPDGIMLSNAEDKENIAIGIIPNGIGNDFAKYWEMSSEYKEAVDCIINNRRRKIDVGTCYYYDGQKHMTRYFLNAINIGLGARIVKITDQCKRFWGVKFLSYFMAFISLIFERKLYRMHLKINGEHIRGRIMTVCIGSAWGYGQAPSAVPYNGWLDVSVIYRPELLQLFSGIWMLMEGRILNHKVVKPYRTQKIKVLRAQNASVDLDGRILDRHFPLDIGVLHEAITLIIPN